MAAKYRKGIPVFSIAITMKSSKVMAVSRDHFFNFFNTGPFRILIRANDTTIIPTAIAQSLKGFPNKILSQKFISLLLNKKIQTNVFVKIITGKNLSLPA